MQIVNQSDAPMEDLVASYSGTEVSRGTARHGRVDQVWFTAGEPGCSASNSGRRETP